MIALGQTVVAVYETYRVFPTGATSYYQYAELGNGAWAFRHKSDRPGQRRATLSWTRWKAASNPPDAGRLAREYERVALDDGDAAQVAQALTDWREGRAYIDARGNYRLKGTGRIALWNKAAKRRFRSSEELHAAATEGGTWVLGQFGHTWVADGGSETPAAVDTINEGREPISTRG